MFVCENLSHIFATKFCFSKALVSHIRSENVHCAKFFYLTFFINLNFISLMNKTELVNSIAEKAGLSKADSKKALDACVEAIVEALKAGDKVSLVGFGTFAVTERPSRPGINPSTKERITIAAKKVAKFKAGADLDDAIN